MHDATSTGINLELNHHFIVIISYPDCLCALNRFILSKQNNQKCKTILLKRRRIQFNKLFINSRKNTELELSILSSTMVKKSISIFCLYGIFLFRRFSSFAALHFTQPAFTLDRMLGHQIATMLHIAAIVSEWMNERVGRFL